MSFPCSRCGACCRRVAIVVPSMDRGDGACVHLAEAEDGTASCAIYEHRPAFCRVDEMWTGQIEGAMPGCTRDDWYAANLSQCATWQEQDGTPVHLRVLP